jgi:hypothetical protein
VGKAPGAVNVEGDIDCDSATVIWTTKQRKPSNNISEYLEKGMDSAVHLYYIEGEAYQVERGPVVEVPREKNGVY